MQFGDCETPGLFMRQSGPPLSPNYHITSQVLAFDFFVPGYLVTSNAVDVQFGARPAEAILYSQGSATAATGSVAQNYGLVTLFN